MGGKLDIYNLGETGVDVVKSPLHEADGDLFKAQNAHADPAGLEGGIRKRDGMAKVNSVALAGPVKGMTGVPLEDLTDGDTIFIYAGARTAGAYAFQNQVWQHSTLYPSVTWAQGLGLGGFAATPMPTVVDPGIGIFTSDDPAGSGGHGVRQYEDKLEPAFPAGFNYRGTSAAQNANRIFYAADDYTLDSEAPPIRYCSTTKDLEMARIPQWFDGSTRRHAKCIVRLIAWNNSIYLSTWDGGTGTNLQGRVFQLDPNSGALTQIGNAFGNQAGENGGGMPFCLAGWNGRLWVGTANGAASPVGGIWWIRPGLDETWTGDTTTVAGSGNILCLQGYTGTGCLYAGTDGTGGSAARVLQRDPNGLWTTSATGVGVTVRSRFDAMAEFEEKLYVHYMEPVAAPATSLQETVRKFDGLSWTTDLSLPDWHFLVASGTTPGQSASGFLVLPHVLILGRGNSPTTGISGPPAARINGTWPAWGGGSTIGGDTVLGYLVSGEWLLQVTYPH